MTTIIADARIGAMAADSLMTDNTRLWRVRKIVRAHGMLMAGAGSVPDYAPVIEWFKANGLEHETETPPTVDSDTSVLILAGDRLWLYDQNSPVPQRLPSQIEAVGTGAVAALAAYEGIGKRSVEALRRAVRIACKHDPGSRPPVYVATVK